MLKKLHPPLDLELMVQKSCAEIDLNAGALCRQTHTYPWRESKAAADAEGKSA